MRAVARKVLEDKLTEYLHLVEEGETVLITDQDRVIAELAPPREERSHLQPVRGAESWITPPAIVAQGPPPRLPVAPLADILRELDEDRADR